MKRTGADGVLLFLLRILVAAVNSTAEAVLSAKNALGRVPKLNEDLLDIKKNFFDKNTKKVIGQTNSWEYTKAGNSDSYIESLIQNEYNKLKDQLEEVYCVSGENVTADNLSSNSATLTSVSSNPEASVLRNQGLLGSRSVS